MRVGIRIVVVTALAAMALAVDAEAQRRTAGTLRVVVEDAEGRPVAGARVILQTSDGKRPRAVEVGEDGRHTFRLAQGHYDLRAHAEGASSEWQRNIPVRPGRRTEVRLRLAADTPAEKPPSADAALPPAPQ